MFEEMTQPRSISSSNDISSSILPVLVLIAQKRPSEHIKMIVIPLLIDRLKHRKWDASTSKIVIPLEI